MKDGEQLAERKRHRQHETRERNQVRRARHIVGRFHIDHARPVLAEEQHGQQHDDRNV